MYLQGLEPLKSANNFSEDDKSVPIHPDPTVLQPPKAVGADIAVCEATGENNLSWVYPNGSKFIKTTLSVWRDWHETEHFLDMMGEVNRQISHFKGEGENPQKKDQLIPAVQMSCVNTTLTYKYYLSIPQHLQQ